MKVLSYLFIVVTLFVSYGYATATLTTSTSPGLSSGRSTLEGTKTTTKAISNKFLFRNSEQRPRIEYESCDNEGFTNGQSLAIKAVTLTGATLSLLGAIFIIFSYFYFSQLQTLNMKLIMFLSIADLGSSLAYLIGAGHSAAQCDKALTCPLTAAMSQYFDVATFLWTSAIAYNIYAVMVRDAGGKVDDYEKYYHGICWGIPLILLVIVSATGALGDSGNWCWIVKDRPLERFFAYYLPLFIVVILNTSLFILVRVAMKDIPESQQKVIQGRLMLYIGVFIFIRIFSVINRFQNAVSPNNGIFALYLLQSIFSPLQGFCNSVIYGMNKKVITEYREHPTFAPIFAFIEKHLCCRGLDEERFLRNYGESDNINMQVIN